MKKKAAPCAVLWAVGLLLAPTAQAANADDIKAAYSSSAFSDADNDWRRKLANRHSQCGRFGKNGFRRIDVLVDGYKAIGEAIDAGDDNLVMGSAERLAKRIDSNKYFRDCWRFASSRGDVSREFKTLMRKI